MTRVAPIQTSFASGEISSLLYGRPEFARYQNGAALVRGFVPLPEGGMMRCPGTRHVGRTSDDDPARLVPFVFNEDDTVMIELTDQLARFWRDGALVQSGGVPYEIAMPYGAAVLDQLQWVQNLDRVYMVDGVQHPKRLNRDGALDNWSVEDTPFENGPMFAQNVDEAKKILASARTGTITLTANFDIFEAGHVGAFWQLDTSTDDDVATWTGNTSITEGTEIRSTNGFVYELVELPSGANTGVNPPEHAEGTVQTEIDGPKWLFKHDGSGTVKITAVTDARTATAEVQRDLPNSTTLDDGTYRWREGLWSGVQGYPRAIGDVEQRHAYGGADASPRFVSLTTAGTQTDMRPSTIADKSFTTIAPTLRRRQSRVQWIDASRRGIHIGTGSDEISSRISETSSALSFESRLVPDTGRGSARIMPANVDGVPVFVGRDERRIYGLEYIFEDDQVSAQNFTRAARHIFQPGIRQIVWQEYPWRVLWVLLDNGELGMIGFEPSEQFVALSRCPVGGIVESIGVLPTADGKSEELWLQVQRTVGGQLQRHVEIMAQPYGLEEDIEQPPPIADAWCLFSAVRYQGAETQTITGLGHLEGETVYAWTDRGGFGPFVVTSAQIELDRAVTSAIVGIDISSQQIVRTLDYQSGAPDGGALGRPKTIRGVGVRMLWSGGGRIRARQPDGRGNYRYSDEVSIINQLQPRLTDVLPRHGVVDVDPSLGWALEAQLEILPDPGAPMLVAGINPLMMQADG